MGSWRWRPFSAYRDPFRVTRMQQRLAVADEDVGYHCRDERDVIHGEPLVAMAFGPRGGVILWTRREVIVLTRNHVMEKLRYLPRDPPPGEHPRGARVLMRRGWHDLIIDDTQEESIRDLETRLAGMSFAPVTLAQADTCFASCDGPPPLASRQDRLRILASELETAARCEMFTIGPSGYQVGWTDDLVFCVLPRPGGGEEVVVMPRHLPPESHFAR